MPLLPWDAQPLDVINGPDSPLKPIFFGYDSDDLDERAKQTLNANAEILKTYGTWVITVEGHCDERGTAEYNLALGDRRALTAKNYLLSLGIGADRVRTVSYGKEFPFNPGHDEASWTINRRAHFMLTSK
jgi:peptidoglycan-associated lipoprotein